MVGDVNPPKDVRAGIVTTSDDPDGWGEDSEEEKLRKAATVGSLGDRRQNAFGTGTRP